jgi:hypothetical protein
MIAGRTTIDEGGRMAKKQAGKKDMTTAAEPTLKAVRLDLPPASHRLLRLLAADDEVSMAAYARDALETHLREEAKKRGIKG